MKILYIFPHPDDESFGPAAAMHQQLCNGHQVYLLTLTRGGATSERFKLGLSVEEMGKIRLEEMKAVKKFLGLTEMQVLDFPDSGLKELDPRELENVVKNIIQTIRPSIVVTYPVHGISGFHDHLVTHAVVKRVFLELKDQDEDYLKRLAFITLPDSGEPVFIESGIRIKQSDQDSIDCIIDLKREDIEILEKSLSCYKTYQSKIKESKVLEKIGDKLYFEFFGENHNPPLQRLEEEL